jgi:hypothetical protein
MAIVGNLEQLQAPIFNHYLNGGRASINSVLNELLEGMYWGNDDFASGDLVDNVLI